MQKSKQLIIINAFLLFVLFSSEHTYAVPNPSWMYSGSLGYKGKIRKTASGAENGIVIFPDGSECDQWDFYYGRCGQQWTHCEQQGFLLLNNSRKNNRISAPSCLLPDASECFDSHLIKKKCQYQHAVSYDRQRSKLTNGFYTVLRSGGIAGENEVTLVQNHKYITKTSPRPHGYLIVKQTPIFPLTSATGVKTNHSETEGWQFIFDIPEKTDFSSSLTAFVFEGEVVKLFSDKTLFRRGSITLDCISSEICTRFHDAVRI